MNDAQHAALLLEVRRGLVECYAAHVKLLRDMAATPAMSVMDGPGALETAANLIENAMRQVRDAG